MIVDSENPRSYGCFRLYGHMQKLISVVLQVVNDLVNQFCCFFGRIVTGWAHMLQIITKNTDQMGFLNIQDNDLTGVIAENHTSHSSANTEVQITRQVTQRFLKKTNNI